MGRWTLVSLELRGAAGPDHLVRMLPLAVLAPFVSLWPHIGSPFAAALVAAFLALEPFYNNTLSTWQGQLTAYALLPAEWTEYLRAKNAATLILTCGVVSCCVVLTAFIQPSPPATEDFFHCALYVLSVVFPLLAAGNSISWQQPRARSGWGLEDAAAGLVMLVLLGVVSIPYLLLSTMEQGELLLLVYTPAAAAVWWFKALPHAANRIHKQFPTLWHTIQTPSP